MSKADEYVEKIITEGFRRESEHEENIVRSLPFFATSLGIVATVVSLVRPALGAPGWQPFAVLTYALLVALGICVLAVFWYLFKSISSRRIAYPTLEADLLAYAEKLREYYSSSGDAAETVDKAIVGDLRELVTGQLAVATRLNRKTNAPRLQARSRALTALVAAVALAFLLLAVIFTRDALSPGESDAGNRRQSAVTAGANPTARSEDGAVGAEAGAAADPHGPQGRLDVSGDRGAR